MAKAKSLIDQILDAAAEFPRDKAADVIRLLINADRKRVRERTKARA